MASIMGLAPWTVGEQLPLVHRNFTGTEAIRSPSVSSSNGTSTPVNQRRLTSAAIDKLLSSPSTSYPSKHNEPLAHPAIHAHPTQCEACGTRTSPEWRKGPSGSRTLCNACGLRYRRSITRNERKTRNYYNRG
ncbi:hypothetical protein BX666DRAFT_1908290 [Dichotomocladium elegans]|nr:hypothetical protein BX666DRAFT_1908290 [Dichotomocladium elegans]